VTDRPYSRYGADTDVNQPINQSTSPTLQLFISCFNKCVKCFFGNAKYRPSVTGIFANLGIVKAQSCLISLNLNFANQLWRCHNPLSSFFGSLLTNIWCY